MKKTGKRILAFFLILQMTVMLFPAVAGAEEEREMPL